MRLIELKEVPLLAGMSEDERGLVAEELESLTVEAGRAVFSEGQEADGLLLLLAGRVQIESRRAPGRAQLGPGAALGALSLVAVGPRAATATAIEASRLLLLRRSAFRRLVEDAPRAACRLIEAILEDLAPALRLGLDRFVGPTVDRGAGAD